MAPANYGLFWSFRRTADPPGDYGNLYWFNGGKITSVGECQFVTPWYFSNTLFQPSSVNGFVPTGTIINVTGTIHLFVVPEPNSSALGVSALLGTALAVAQRKMRPRKPLAGAPDHVVANEHQRGVYQ
jgi:hypothetical protein